MSRAVHGPSDVAGTGDRIVQLHFPPYVHPVYREQLHAVPDGWRYRSGHPALRDATVPTKRVVQEGRLGPLVRFAESAGARVLSEAGYVHRNRVRADPAAQIVHSAERLLWRSPLPYVVDLEHASLFVLYQQAAMDRPWARTLLEHCLLDERLRFLLPWSDAARRSVLAMVSREVGTQLEPKLRTVSPAIRLAAERPRARSSGPLRVLFVGTAFIEKGGVEAVEALRLARASCKLEMDLVSFVPADWAGRLAAEPGLTVHEPGGADLIQRLYAQADALLFPSHMDTFGYVVLEAMAHGLPVLAPRHLALEETVQDGVSGLLFSAENMLFSEDTVLRFRHTIPVPRRYREMLRHPTRGHVAGIADQLVRLAEEPGLHARLAEGAFESVRSGPLSVDRRRALLREIYDAAAA
jgi:glycosyltransferase involved in cell wall biosynthesis